MYVTSSKIKGKVANDQLNFRDCLMTIIVNTQSPEIVSTSSDVSETKFTLSKRFIDMQIMIDELSINRKPLSRKCDKSVNKSYALKNYNYYTFWSI